MAMVDRKRREKEERIRRARLEREQKELAECTFMCVLVFGAWTSKSLRICFPTMLIEMHPSFDAASLISTIPSFRPKSTPLPPYLGGKSPAPRPQRSKTKDDVDPHLLETGNIDAEGHLAALRDRLGAIASGGGHRTSGHAASPSSQLCNRDGDGDANWGNNDGSGFDREVTEQPTTAGCQTEYQAAHAGLWADRSDLWISARTLRASSEVQAKTGGLRVQDRRSPNRNTQAGTDELSVGARSSSVYNGAGERCAPLGESGLLT